MSRKDLTDAYIKKYPYPRRLLIRHFLRGLLSVASVALTEYHVEGKENLPKDGPLLIVSNHFHFLDSIGPIRSTDYLIEFINDLEIQTAPASMRFLPRLWGTLKLAQCSPNS